MWQRRLIGAGQSSRLRLTGVLVLMLGLVPASMAIQTLAATPASGTAPRYQNYTPKNGQGTDAGEPSIGADWRTGNAMFQSYLTTFQVHFDDCSSPAADTWLDKSAPTSKESLDPILFTDSATCRTFVSELAGATSLSSFSDDDGATWTPESGGGPTGGVDHQTYGGGPFAPNDLIGATGTYTHAVYYCSQGIASAFCQISRDGGATYEPSQPLYTKVDCGGLHGHVKVAPDGTVYIPNKSCGTTQGVAVSTNGITYTLKHVTGSTPGNTDPSVGIGANNTVYFGYMASNGHAHITVSRDRGDTWTDDTDVGAQFGLQNIVFPTVTAGDDDRAAFAFIGTTTAGNYSDINTFHGVWHLYVAHTFDGGKTWITSDVTPNDPVQRGSICTSGTTCGADRNLLDFIDITRDKFGRVMVAYADGCTGPCVTSDNPADNSRSALATIARQSGGRRLFAKYDPVEPAVPGALLLTATPGPGGIHLSWPEPDNGGSPITGYKIYRGTASGQESLLATLTGTQTTYDDAFVQPGTTYYYRVTALNVVGESPVCREASATAGALPKENTCTLPGLTVLTDSTGDELDQQSEHDIQKLSIAEPYTPNSPDSLVMTLKMADLSTLTPDTYWRVYFNTPGAKVPSYVDMRSDVSGTSVSYAYSYSSATVTTTGALDKGSTYTADGTITMVISKSKIGNPAIGQKLAPIYVRVIVGAVVPDNANYPTPSASVSYTFAGNAQCATSNPTPTGTVGIGTPGPTQTGTINPTQTGTINPTQTGTINPTQTGTINPTQTGTVNPMQTGTINPTQTGTINPTQTGTINPTQTGTINPTQTGTVNPTQTGTINPTSTTNPNATPTSTGGPPTGQVYFPIVTR